jgi:Ras-related GTP-binding protein C/D
MAQDSEDWGDGDGEGYAEEPLDLGDGTPKILLMGARRSGKSSMAGVVFSKMPPHETMFMDQDNGDRHGEFSGSSFLDVKHVANNAFVQFQVWDFPGDFVCGEDELIYGGKVMDQ